MTENLEVENKREEEFVEVLSEDEPAKQEIQNSDEIASQPVEEPSDDLPEKYKGKDIKEVIRMHQEAEKALGRQSNEVGELRKVFDEYIQSKTIEDSKTESQPVEISDDDYWSNPSEAVTKSIDTHPAIVEAKQAAARLKQQEAVASLKASHADYETILQDQSFLEWVGKSKVRKELLNKAHVLFDVDAADELFTNWKERKQYVDQVKQTSKENTQKMVQKASVGNVSGSAEPAPVKKYRREDLRILKQNNPARYKAILPEITRAYMEGRVV